MKIEAICGLAAFLVYMNTFDAEFVYDDSRAILKNQDVRLETPLYEIFLNDFWGTRMTHSGSHRSYRPITVLTFRLNYAISAFNPWSYHVTNVIVHSLTSSLFVHFVRTKLYSSLQGDSALFVGLLFAVHPIHTEAVAGLVGRADVLAGLFVMLALLSYSKSCDIFAKTEKKSSEKLYNSGGIEKPKAESASRSSKIKSKSKSTKKRQKMESRSHRHKAPGKINSSQFCDVNDEWGTTRSTRHVTDIPSKSSMTSRGSLIADSSKEMNNHHVQIIWMKILPSLPYAFSLCALLSKEQGVCALPVCAIYDIWIRNQLGLTKVFRIIFFQTEARKYADLRKRIIGLATFCIASLFIRISVWSLFTEDSKGSFVPTFSPSDNPVAVSASLATRIMTFNYLLAFNAWMLMCPNTLSYDWSMDCIPLVESIFDFRNAFTFTLYAIILTLAKTTLGILILRDKVEPIDLTDQGTSNLNLQPDKSIFRTKTEKSKETESPAKQTIYNCLETRSELEIENNSRGEETGNCIKTRLTYECGCLLIGPFRTNVECFQLSERSQCCYSEGLKCSQTKANSDLPCIRKTSLRCKDFTESSKFDETDLIQGSDQTRIDPECSISLDSRTNPETTNSSGYATESSIDDLIENGRYGEKMKITISNLGSAQATRENTKGTQCTDNPSEMLTQNEHEIVQENIITDKHISDTIMGISLLIIPFLPATNLFFYVGFVVAERLLYIPSMGYCILIGCGLSNLGLFVSKRIKSAKFLRRTVVAFLLLAFAIRTVQRNEHWRDEYSLYRSGISVSPAKSWANLGNVLKGQNRILEAEFAYKEALHERSNMADVHYNLGLLYQEQHRYDEALAKYNSAILFRPSLAVAHLNKGIVLTELGKVKEAESVSS